jgi:two-component system LytT family sensor kinase
MLKTFYKLNFLTRLIIIYLIHLMIKAFDYSFGHFLEFTARGLFFSIGFVSIWLAIWYLAEWVNEKIRGWTEILRLVVNLFIGFSAGLLTNMSYRYSDIHIHDMHDTWKDIGNFNPELTVSLALIYIIGYGIYEYLKISLIKKDQQIKAEKLKKESISAQYQSLKNQIEPHFLFNSLSVLSSIIHSNTDLASDFLLKLSKTLRFILEKNQFDLVPLSEEIEMINDYYFLLKTRFNDGVSLELNIKQSEMKEVFIPPASIQLLIENAIKHNKLSPTKPIEISIHLDQHFISVSNNINRKTNDRAESTGLGLKNIAKRYELIAQKQIEVMDSKDVFTVKLPLLNHKDYENFNH